MADEQTDARKNLPAPARQLIATARNDITIPFFNSVLAPQDDTLIQRGGGKGLKIYDEVERDTHAYAVLQKRKLALVGREWEIKPASDSAADRRAAEFIEQALDDLAFDKLCLDLLDATLKGFSIVEIVWKRDGAAIAIDKLVAHDQRRFVFDEFWRPRLLTREAPLEGVELPDRKFLVHRFGVKGNDPYGLGLGSRLFWPVLFKREGVAFWLTFLEKFASPTPVGKYPQGTLPSDQNTLLRSLQDMVQAGAIVVPIGSEISFLEAQRAGQAGYQDWCQYWDKQMALCVFGSTLATNIEGQGSRAAAETHKESEEQIVDADGDLLSDTLRDTLLRWLVDYNVPGAEPPTVRRVRAKNETADEELREKRGKNAEAELNRLFDLGQRVGEDKFVEVAAALANIDLMPQVPIDVLRHLAPHVARARDNLTAAARAGRLKVPANDEERAQTRAIAFADPADDHGLLALTEQLLGAAAPATDDMVKVIRREIASAIAAGEDLPAMRDRLLTVFGDISIDPLGEIIASGLAVAELTGRADVADEIAAKRRRR